MEGYVQVNRCGRRRPLRGAIVPPKANCALRAGFEVYTS